MAGLAVSDYYLELETKVLLLAQKIAFKVGADANEKGCWNLELDSCPAELRHRFTPPSKYRKCRSPVIIRRRLNAIDAHPMLNMRGNN